ncbi:MAG TPA: oxidoreductase [Nitrospinaceae bacterium]|nr:oxidoreductase [Nitrospinaceae bacterium]
MNLGVKGTGINREYSTYSGKDDPYIEFLIKDVSGGLVSPALRKLAIGTEVDIHGPYGSFTLDPEKINTSSYFFLGTGTGIAPYHSYIRSFPNLNYQVIVGIRYNSERYDQQDYESSRITYCVSREKGADLQGRITDYLKNFKVIPNHMFYLCGNNHMINDSYELLREKGASGHQIFTEAFF